MSRRLCRTLIVSMLATALNQAAAQTPTPTLPSRTIPRDILIPKISSIEILETPMFVTNEPNRLYFNQKAKMRLRLDKTALVNQTIKLAVEYSPSDQGQLLIVPASVTVPAGKSVVLFDASADPGASTASRSVTAVILATLGKTTPFRAPSIKVERGAVPTVAPICDVIRDLILNVSPLTPRPGDVVTLTLRSSCAPRGGGFAELIRNLPEGTTLTPELSQALSAVTANEPRNISIPAYRTVGTATYVAGAPAVNVPRRFQAFLLDLNNASNAVNFTYQAGECNPILTVSLSPTAAARGGSTTATATLSCPLNQDLTVQFVPVSTSVQVPGGNVTIPAGSLSASGTLVVTSGATPGSQIEVRANVTNRPATLCVPASLAIVD